MSYKIITQSDANLRPFGLGDKIHISAPAKYDDDVKNSFDTARKFAERLGEISLGIADFEAGGFPEDLTAGEIREFQRAMGVLKEARVIDAPGEK